jgi:hypothetical protein
MKTIILLLLVSASSAAADEPASQPTAAASKRNVEVWVEPLSTVFNLIPAATGFFQPVVYVSAGATVDMVADWQMVLGLAVGAVAASDRVQPIGQQAAGAQIALTLAPVRFFRQRTSRSGFFIGPKLVSSIVIGGAGTCANNSCFGKTEPGDHTYTAADVELGIEMGYRFQLGRIALTIIPPSISIGYAWNWGLSASAFSLLQPPSAGTPRTGVPVYGLDLSLVRVGVDF